MSGNENENQKALDLDGINAIPLSHRSMSMTSYVLVYWSSVIAVQVMVVGLYLMPPNGVLNFQQTLMAGFLSGIIGAFMIAINGDAGARYGIPYIIQARSSFGVDGAKVVGLIRAVPAICWNGICTWFGADALRVVTQQVFGFGNTYVFFIIILLIEAYLAMKGVESIKWFDATMSIVIFGMLFYFFYVIFSTSKVDFSKATGITGSWGLPFFAGVMGSVANLTTVLLNSSDLTRHVNFGKESKLINNSIAANLAGTIPPWMFMFATGVIIALATGSTNPIEGLATLAPNPVFGLILLVFIMLAQVTSNLSMNILPPALAFQEVFKCGWKTGIIIVTVASVAICPWILFTSEYFFVFQNVYSCFLGPILGVLVSDYYFIRKKVLNIPELYQGDKYRYVKGYSVIACTALVFGAALSAVFFQYSWLVGFPSTLVFYTILKRCWKIERHIEQAQGITIG